VTRARAARRTGSTRDRALLTLLYGTGLRLAEATALDVDDVPTTERTGAVHVRAGQGERPRTVPLPADARSLLRRWLTERANIRPPSGASPPCGWAAGTACPPGSSSASSPSSAPTPGWWTSARTPCGTPRRPAG
jgi:integrase